MIPYLWLVRIGVFVVLVGCGAAGVWLKAKHHYETKYNDLKAAYEQAAKVQEAHTAEVVEQHKATAERIDHEAQEQIGSMGTVIADLSKRLHDKPRGSPGQVPAPAPSAPVADAAANGPTVETGDRCLAAVAPADVAAGLDIGIDALEALLLWREWAREVEKQQ
jgi:hypothetical protein